MTAQEILSKYPHTTQNILEHHLKFMMEQLEKTKDIEGEVIEVGCHAGLTSVYFRRVLNEIKSTKQFHAYDSFQGLPKKKQEDLSVGIGETFKEGYFDLKGTWQIEERFRNAKLELPILHQGWFADQEYPDKISFAFLDGDFYSSIKDSLQAVWHKMSKGGIVCIHDYGWEALPGVERACREFFGEKYKDKITNLGGLGYIYK